MMKRVQTAVISALLALSAGGLSAQSIGENHNVRIERGGFYPPTVYVANGDTITFTNHINKNANLHSVNYYYSRSDWREDTIGYLEQRVVTITPNIERTLRAPCFRTSPPPWWSDASDKEWEIASSNDSAMCDGWQYSRTHNRLEIVFGTAPDGS